MHTINVIPEEKLNLTCDADRCVQKIYTKIEFTIRNMALVCL